MASTIQLKSGTGSAVPSSLTQGEVAINIDNGLFYYGSGSGDTVKQLQEFTNITASGHISASGIIIGAQLKSDGEFFLDGVRNLYRTSTNLFVGATDRKTKILGTNIILSAPVTASIISASTSLTTPTLIGNGSDLIFKLGTDSDGDDRTIIYGHSTLKTIMGIDDSADAFVINTDAAFDGTLANNSFSIDANHNVIIAGDITSGDDVFVGDDLSLTSDSSVFNMGENNDFTITHDGTTGATLAGTPITINSTGDLTLDSTTDIVLDAAGNDFKFKVNGTHVLSITNSSSDVIIKPIVDAKDLIFQQRDGTEVLKIDDDGTAEFSKRKIALAGGTDGNHAGADVVYFGGTTSMTTGAIYHFKSDSTWELADADDNTKSDGLLGVALGAASDTNGVLLRGMVTLDHDPGAVGDPIYLTTTAGDSSATAPSGNNNIVRIIGYCLHASNGNIWFNPDSTFVEVTA